MDEDLANIIRTALDEAKIAGRDDSGQTEYAVRKVLELRHDMTPLRWKVGTQIGTGQARINPYGAVHQGRFDPENP